MPDNPVLSMTVGPVPEPVAPLADSFGAESVVLRAAPAQAQQGPWQPGWLNHGLMGIRSASLMDRVHEAQQEARRQKADEPAGRTSRDTDAERRGGRYGATGDYVDPPFDLHRLAFLLYLSPDYFAVVDQMAIDIAGDWLLVDRSKSYNTLRGEVVMDAAAKAQAAQARGWLDSLPRGFDDEPINVTEFSNRIFMDRLSMGNAYAEVVRDPTRRPARLIHVPGYLVRRHAQGGRYVQVDDMGRPLGYFRQFGVAPTERDTITQEEYGYSNQPVGSLKSELADFHRYHPAERYYGVPPIVSAFNAVCGNIFASNRNVRFFVNRGMPDYVCMVKASQAYWSKNKADLDSVINVIKDHMQYMLEGEDHKTLILRIPTGDIEVAFETIGGIPKDQEWGNFQHDNRDTVLRVYRMPPSQIGIIETAHLGSGTGENQAERYKRAQIEPPQRQAEAFWNLILDQGGFDLVRFRYAELDIIDEHAEIASYSAASGVGDISINEGRAWLSRIVKDQDFPPEDHEYATLPWRLVQLIAAELAAAGQVSPLGGPGAAPGLIPTLTGQRPGLPRPPAAADVAAMRTPRQVPEVQQSRFDRARQRFGLTPTNGAQP